MDASTATKKLIRRHGRRQLQSEVEAIASCVLPKYSLNNRADHISMVVDYQK